eukprot:Hpha_TRINITY_DN2897_c0_g1::TRINITY_DN2897_c0_g1_i1::g.171356::m.171356
MRVLPRHVSVLGRCCRAPRYASEAVAGSMLKGAPVEGSGAASILEDGDFYTGDMTLYPAHSPASRRRPDGAASLTLTVRGLLRRGRFQAAEAAIADAALAGTTVSAVVMPTLAAAAEAGDTEAVQRLVHRLSDEQAEATPAVLARASVADSLKQARQLLGRLSDTQRRSRAAVHALLRCCRRSGDAAGADSVVAVVRRSGVIRGDDIAGSLLVEVWATAGDPRCASFDEALLATSTAPPLGALSCAAACRSAADTLSMDGQATGEAEARARRVVEVTVRVLGTTRGTATELDAAGIAALAVCERLQDAGLASRVAAPLRSRSVLSPMVHEALRRAVSTCAGDDGRLSGFLDERPLKVVPFPRDMEGCKRLNAAYGSNTTSRDWWTAIKAWRG